MSKSKKKLDENELSQASILKRTRGTWKINPGTRVISKSKILKRNKLKQNLRKEIDDID